MPQQTETVNELFVLNANSGVHVRQNTNTSSLQRSRCLSLVKETRAGCLVSLTIFGLIRLGILCS